MNIWLYLVSHDYRVHRRALGWLKKVREMQAVGLPNRTIRNVLYYMKMGMW